MTPAPTSSTEALQAAPCTSHHSEQRQLVVVVVGDKRKREWRRTPEQVVVHCRLVALQGKEASDHPLRRHLQARDCTRHRHLDMRTNTPHTHASSGSTLC